jgi:osmoprotectant transport system permease protein
VAAQPVREHGVVIDWLLNRSLDWDWMVRNAGLIGGLTLEHAILAVVPVLAAFVVSVPLGYLVFRTGKAANALLAVLGLIYSIPSLALFVLMPAFLNSKILDPINIAVALAIYSVALLVRSVVDGLRSVPGEVRQSASAIGFGTFRRFLRVELPLAMPVVFAGLRVVTVSNIALVSVGVLIGLGSLGQLFDTGFNRNFYTPIIIGIALTVLLALVADALILLIQRGVLPWARGRRIA